MYKDYVTVKIDKEILKDLFYDRCRFITDNSSTGKLLSEYYGSLIDNDFFDGINLDIELIVDNDFINNFLFYDSIEDFKKDNPFSLSDNDLEDIEQSDYIVFEGEEGVIIRAY